uniref:Uncharacterized protein n=1 Tax=Arundo donax TaxID=35708 RepID=A0A0A8ZIA7_ARUDO
MRAAIFFKKLSDNIFVLA